MSEENNTATETTTENTTTEEQPEQSLNSQAKNLPWVQDLMKAAARADALEKEKAERAEAEEKAARNAELEKAKSEANYEEALRLQREEAEREISTLKQAALTADIKAALLAEGARKSEGFFRVAVAEYDAEKHDSIESYVSNLKSNEEYSLFFGSADRAPLPSPGKPGNGVADVVDWNRVKQMERSTKREDRMEARRMIREYRLKNGKYPYEVTKEN